MTKRYWTCSDTSPPIVLETLRNVFSFPPITCWTIKNDGYITFLYPDDPYSWPRVIYEQSTSYWHEQPTFINRMAIFGNLLRRHTRQYFLAGLLLLLLLHLTSSNAVTVSDAAIKLVGHWEEEMHCLCMYITTPILPTVANHPPTHKIIVLQSTIYSCFSTTRFHKWQRVLVLYTLLTMDWRTKLFILQVNSHYFYLI